LADKGIDPAAIADFPFQVFVEAWQQFQSCVCNLNTLRKFPILNCKMAPLIWIWTWWVMLLGTGMGLSQHGILWTADGKPYNGDITTLPVRGPDPSA
jgi:hypothetical protein